MSQKRNSHINEEFCINLESLEDRLMLSTVDVFAAGVTNEETIELQIDGQTVQVWENIGGDAYAGEFEKFTFQASENVDPSQIRVAFVNDLYDPAAGIDRNVRIDKIVVNGQTTETESSSVFSTGTWKPEDGIQPGFRQSEYLQGNGYFQYGQGGGGSVDGSKIDIVVRGDEGTEKFNLLIKGQVVGTYDVTTNFQTISYTHNGSFTADDVRIEFINDAWDPAQGIDANLVVDRIVVDGEVFETEDPSVFSTGSWTEADGIQPGFGRSERLNINGYFQYSQGGGGSVDGSKIDIVVRGDEGTEKFNLLIKGQVVGTYDVTTNFQTISYTHNGSFTADDVRIEFINDAWDPAQGIDANLVVDRIVVDGEVFETEDPSVFSTGSWIEADGIQPGFGRSERLNINGYFQYASKNNPGPSNQAPVARKDYYTVEQGQTVVGNVGDNDFDPDGNDNNLVFKLLTQPAFGQIMFNADGSFTYTADSNNTGDIVFDYSVTDEKGARTVQEACITVTPKVDRSDFDQDGKIDSVDTDDDNDGLLDTEEAGLGTDPFNRDSDGDGLQDGTELGRTSAGADSFGGPVSFRPDADPSTTTNPLNADTDGDGLTDGQEDTNFDGSSPNTIGATGTSGSGETDPNNPDTDGDGLRDGDEVNNIGSDPLDVDTDDGGLWDRDEVVQGSNPVNNPADDFPSGDNDQDGKPDNVDQDDDNDGIPDAEEAGLGTDPLNPDTDGDGLQDGTEVGRTQGTPDSFGGPVSFRPDADPSTTTNPLNPDTDGDGLRDGQEDPNLDGASPRTIGGTGTTGSGETDPNNPDTDGDGLTDGDEVNNIGSDPLDTDTDDGTVPDGVEVNQQGTNPVNNPGDDVLTDTDQDGRPDNIDTDDDNDGILDVDEPTFGTDPLDPDTDDDGILDGTEVGVTSAGPDSFGGPISFRPDSDPGTTTNPLDPDSDNDGLTDGQEDPNADGASPRFIGGTGTTGNGETDPNNPDTDGDGLTDGQEVNQIGSNPLDTDTDDGTTPDGVEVNQQGTDPVNNPADDVLADFDQDGRPDNIDTDDDNDGLSDTDELARGTDPFDQDTDDDGVQDGTEVGVGPGGAGPDSFGGPLSFTPDADPGSTTNPLNPDTDGDGLTDGQEDPNGDGASPRTIGGTGTTGSGETDPNNPDTDGDGLTDGDEVNNIGSDPLDTDTDDGTVPDGVEVNQQGTNPVNNPGDDIVAPPNVARIVGADRITEYRTDIRSRPFQTESYRIQTDIPVTQDTVFVINTNDITANRTSDPRASTQRIGWGPAATAQGQAIRDADPLDYTLSQNGVTVPGQLTLTVRAGQTVSQDTFEVDAWGEFTYWGPDPALFSQVFEDLETFQLDIVQAQGTTQPFTLIDKTVQIFDDQAYYVYDISPIALDLNGDGEIGVTGETTVRGARTSIGETVQFDIDADGKLDTIEWFAGDGDGILVNTTLIGANNEIDGSALFGDQGGKYDNGYVKLSLLDADGDGAVSGSEADSLGLWIDDGDAVLEEGELKSLSDYQIVSLSTAMDLDAEGRMISTATKSDGSSILTEDVWFAGV